MTGSRKMTLLQILEAALGPDYSPAFRRRLKAQLPRSMWLDISRKKVEVPAAGTPEWEQLKAAAWLVEGARLAWEDRRRAEAALLARRN